MKQIYIFLAFVVGCAVLAGCGADAVAPTAHGDIIGFAGLRDETGARYSDQSGVTVRIKGSDRSGITDTVGVWKLNDVAAGIYDLEFSKPGFAMNYLRAFQFVGGGTAYYTSLIDLIRTKRDTLRNAVVSFAPDYEVRYLDTLIETDTGWVHPLDTTVVPNRFLRLQGDVTFEDDTQQISLLYLRPHFTDLLVVPTSNYQLDVVKRGHNDLQISVYDLLQRGYPRGVPVEVVFTTRQNNTFYFEPSTRQRIITDPHDLLRVLVTIPEE